MNNFFDTLVNGNHANNKLAQTTPLQKLTLRFAVVSLNLLRVCGYRRHDHAPGRV